MAAHHSDGTIPGQAIARPQIHHQPLAARWPVPNAVLEHQRPIWRIYRQVKCKFW